MILLVIRRIETYNIKFKFYQKLSYKYLVQLKKIILIYDILEFYVF
jgi:hypothetical protein